MNQQELNQIAMNFIYTKSLEVEEKVVDLLLKDMQETDNLSLQSVKHIHNLALYHVIARINYSLETIDDDEKAADSYIEFVNKNEDSFMSLCEYFRDFTPDTNIDSDSEN